MSHLSRDERLLALDGTLDKPRHAHLAGCPACATEVEGLRLVLARVRAVDMPEPSPLFWDHLAARVGDAIAQEPVPALEHRWWSPRLAWAALAVVAVAAGAGYLTRSGTQPAPVVAHGAPPVVELEPAAAAAVAANTDEIDPPLSDDGWALLAAVAEDAEPDETFAPAVGQAELSLSSLTAEERTAVAAELSAELDPGRTREG